MANNEEKIDGQSGKKKPFFSASSDDLTASCGSSREMLGGQIGPYKLLGILGEGGYGIVYLAEQHEPIRRRVALKIIKPGMDTKQVIARFEAERQALALFNHPNIAHVYEAGITKAGRPYFVMEHVKGMPITEHCDQEKSGIEERLKLFLDICDAIQYAHQKGIIHRDIKPSNILVSIDSKRAVPKVIDFGVAKAISQPLTERTLYTEQGQLIGTPEYMSPEQAEMTSQDIDTRSDVYSLGVVLYELLTGVLPFDPETLRDAGIDRLRQIIREEEPKTPSTRLSHMGEQAVQIATNRRTEPGTLSHRLHKELEWIPMKAMRKERERRYQSISELADDIQNYLNNDPLIAGPESTFYHMTKFVRRNKVYVVTSSIVILTVFLAMAVITKFYLDTRKLAEARRRELYCKNISLIDGIYKNQQLSGANRLLKLCPDDLKGWEWDRLQHILDESEFTINSHAGVIDRLAKQPDGKHIWSCSRDKTIRCWDLDTGQEIHRLFDPCTPMTICISHSGFQLATGDQVGNITLWDTNSGKQILAWPGHKGCIETLSFDCNDSRLLSEAEDQILIWDVESGRQLMDLRCRGTYGQNATWSSDGSMIAAIQLDKVTIYDAQNGSEIVQFGIHDPECGNIQFSHDNSLIVVCGKRIWFYDAKTGALQGALPGSKAHINSMDLSPDDRYLVTGDEQGFIKVWDLSDLREVVTLHGHFREVLSVTFDTDGRRIMSSGNDAIKVWDPEIDRKYLDLLGHQSVCFIAFSPDSQRLVSASEDRTLKVWDLVSGSEVLTLCGHRGKVWSAAFTLDGKHIISGSDDSTVRVWDATKGDLLTVLEGHEKAVLSVAASSDNKWIASAGADHTIRLWDRGSGKEMRTFLGHQNSVTCVAFNSDASRLASGGLDKTIRVWDVTTGRTVAIWSDEDLLRANNISFGQDGTLLLAGTPIRYSDHGFKVYRRSRMARFYDFVNGRENLSLIWYAQIGTFSPDRTRFVNRRDLDCEVRDALTDDLLLILDPRCVWHGTAVFSPDGRTIATSAYFGGIGIFESVPPSGGYQIRKSARDARILVDELHEKLNSYTSVIESIQDDRSLNESIRHFALQISNSRLSAEQYYSVDE